MSGSFGSRNDMISDKFNAVAKIKIFTEMVQREKKNMKINGKFSVNPKSLVYLPLKPTQLDPVQLQKQLDAPDDSSTMDPELTKKIADSRMEEPCCPFELFPMSPVYIYIFKGGCSK